jgi:hypothetical protein
VKGISAAIDKAGAADAMNKLAPRSYFPYLAGPSHLKSIAYIDI